MPRRLFRLWLVWFVLVWVVSFSWVGFTPAPQWGRVHWVPFSDPADKFRDVFANILLFFPFGFLVARRRPGARGLMTIIALALAISVSAEAMQLFSTVRHPSATDVTAAVWGAVAGAVTTLSLRQTSKPPTWTD
ncbi:MAG TPA: VanZ family protein [Vicinamibacterales bacterium]|nr:VanZ family protein [Vicinamibacterales bacterium]